MAEFVGSTYFYIVVVFGALVVGYPIYFFTMKMCDIKCFAGIPEDHKGPELDVFDAEIADYHRRPSRSHATAPMVATTMTDPHSRKEQYLKKPSKSTHGHRSVSSVDIDFDPQPPAETHQPYYPPRRDFAKYQHSVSIEADKVVLPNNEEVKHPPPPRKVHVKEHTEYH